MLYTFIVEICNRKQRFINIKYLLPTKALKEFSKEDIVSINEEISYRVLFVLSGNTILFDADEVERLSKAVSNPLKYVNNVRLGVIYKIGRFIS